MPPSLNNDEDLGASLPHHGELYLTVDADTIPAWILPLLNVGECFSA